MNAAGLEREVKELYVDRKEVKKCSRKNPAKNNNSGSCVCITI